MSLTPPLFALVVLAAATLSHAQTLTPEMEKEWRTQIRANFFIPDPLPELKATTHRRFELAPGVSAEAVTYDSQFGLRVPAILYLPNPLPKAHVPGVVVVNGHGGDKYSWYSFYTGVLYARAGAAVLTFDPAGEGERNIARKSGTRAHDRLKGDEILARRLEGLFMTDVMQGVSYLTLRPEVDPARIGAGGYSLGSFILALTGAVETRLHACVLSGGGNLDGLDGYWDNSKPMCQGLPYRSLAFLGDRPAAIYALHAARGPTLVWNGLADTVVGMDKTPPPFFEDLQARTIRRRGKADNIFETGFTPDVSHRPQFVTRPVALWLHKHLAFPNWTAASIEAMPETHISEWAATKGVFIDKGYASEDREGGIRALGDGVPGFTREELSVFSEEEWQKEKPRLVLESWEAAARAAK